MPRPTDSPTFVYGVGAVGYQNCPACGSKWRYLWQESKAASPRARRPSYALIGGLAAAVMVGVVAFVAFRGSPTKYPSGKSAPNPPITVARSTPTSPGTPTSATTPPLSLSQAGTQFTTTIGETNQLRIAFMQWVVTEAPTLSELDVNQHVTEFVGPARRQVRKLAAQTWPPEAAGSVAHFVTTYETFLDDAELVAEPSLLNSPSFIQKLEDENFAVREAATAARQDLRLEAKP